VILPASGEEDPVIKEVRAITGLGLKEARTWWTGAQAGEEGISKAEAEEIQKKLVDAVQPSNSSSERKRAWPL